jgi:hypothetical protein
VRLPNGEKAFIADEKLAGYCLNLQHPRGRHKARLFASKLGISRKNEEVLRRALLLAAAAEEATFLGEDQFGRRFAVEFDLRGPSGFGRVRSYWIIRRDEEYPRLITCYTF